MRPAIDEPSLSAWLLSPDSRRLKFEDLFIGLAQRLQAAGLPIWRMTTSLRTQHPEVFVLNLSWRRDQPLESHLRPWSLMERAVYQESPIVLLHRHQADRLRCRLQGPEADLRFNICQELAAAGGSDYLIHALDYSDGQRSYLSFATDHPLGFLPEQLALLDELVPLLALRNELAAQRFATECLLRVYLGPHAAVRVLDGRFHRGQAETLRAVIWFSDMRGFTALSDRIGPERLVGVLDRFFDAVVEPLSAHGGEVLKFIGDAVLAIFPLPADAAEKQVADICQAALDAAEAALAGVTALAGSLNEPLAAGIGLHLGSLTFGNVGATERLDFTVIGASVNEASRVEGLCKDLGQPLLLTEDFARALAVNRAKALYSFGRQQLRGVSRPIEIFAPGGKPSELDAG